MSQFFKSDDIAIADLVAWAQKHVADDAVAMIVIAAPTNIRTITLTERDLSVKDRLLILQRAVDAQTSQRPDAIHERRKF